MIGSYKVFIDKIAYKLVEDKSIEAEDIEAYKFGIEVTILKILHDISYFTIALCMEKVLEFVVIFAILYSFRRNTGGFHAKTRIGCYLFSCAVIFLSLLITELGFEWWSMLAISIFDLGALLFLSPVQHKNRRLGSDEIECFRHRLKIISVIFLLIYVTTMGLEGWYYIMLYTVGLTMVTLLTILGKIQSMR